MDGKEAVKSPPFNLQQSYMQSGYAPQSEFAPAAYPSQPGFNSSYGAGLPPPTQHVPISDEEPIIKGFEYSDASIRRGFIRKVYSILSVQLLTTLSFVLLSTFHDGTKLFVKNNEILLFLAIILSFATIIILCCCEGVRRTSPANMILLSVFTLSETYVVGLATVRYDPQIVIMAVLFTTVVVIALTVFAMQTKWDFTTLGGTLFVTVWIFVLVTLLLAFVPKSPIVVIMISSVGAILFSVYLIHDTQLIIGGDHKFSISPEEYVLGAITLFLDILNIFLYILRILAASSKN